MYLRALKCRFNLAPGIKNKEIFLCGKVIELQSEYNGEAVGTVRVKVSA